MHRLRILFILLACATSPVAAQSPNPVKPGNDFFTYANRDWLSANPLPAGTERWTARSEINAKVREQLTRLYDSAAVAPAGSLARKVADFRTAWLNQAVIEGKGLRPVRALLDSIERLHDKAGLTRFLGAGMLADVDPLGWGVYRSAHLLGLAVQPSIHGEIAPVPFLLQGGLGLGDREQYLDPERESLRQAYQQYVARLLGLAGFGHAIERAHGVMALELALARTQATAEASARDRNADTVWTRADFARRAPGLDWPAFLGAAGLAAQDSFGVWQPGAVTGVAALVSSASVESWKDYLRFHALHDRVDLLPRAFGEAAETLRRARPGAAPSAPSRVDRAAQETEAALGTAVGQLYAERYFPPAEKARLQAIVANVIEAFRKRVAAASWMSPETRATALAKVGSVYFGVGYPERWEDWSDLVIRADDPVGNFDRIRARSYRRALVAAGRKVNTTEWWMPAHRVGAILMFQLNSYNFPAALLQPPKYDPAASDAANYGAIGAIVGHEVSHYVDLLGMEYDARLRMQRWWTPEDSTRFQTAAAPLMRQVGTYEPVPGVHVNSTVTEVEDVADLAGLMAAFDAYRATLGGRASDPAYVKQQDREFFLGFARSWRSRYSETALRTQLASDNHTPDRFRIATVRNLDAWYDAFDVMPGDSLYLEKGERVKVW